VIFWVGFGLRVLVVLVGHQYKIRTDQANFNFGFEAGRIARSLATGHGYANPFNGVSGPTAWLPPLFPLLLGGVFKVFGVYSRASGFVILTLNSLFSAAVAPAVYEIAARVFDAKGIARRGADPASGHGVAEPVALWSAWVWAVYPAALQYAIHWVWEMSLTAMLFAWVIVVALRLREEAGSRKQEVGSRNLSAQEGQTPGAKAPISSVPMRPEAKASGYPEAWEHTEASGYSEASGHSEASWHSEASGHTEASGYAGATEHTEASRSMKAIRLWAVFGVLWGLIALSNASLLLCFPAMMVWVVWSELRAWRWASLRRDLVGVVVACLVFGLVLSPWVVRNERVFHAFVPTRGNLGVELYESTLERNDGFPWGTTLPLWPGDPEFRRYVAMGEVRYSAMRGAEAKARILARPGRTARWTLDRFFFFWDGTPHPPDRHPVQEYLRQLSYCFISVCGLLGLALMLRRRVEGAGLFAAIFVLLPLPYYLVTVQPRFRHPMEPVIAVLAVYLFRSAEKKRIEDRG
jgi:hypothetical protein